MRVIVSKTVTTAEADAVFPSPSKAVNTTVFAPTSEQSKLVLSILKVTFEQLSVVPLSMLAAVILPKPDWLR